MASGEEYEKSEIRLDTGPDINTTVRHGGHLPIEQGGERPVQEFPGTDMSVAVEKGLLIIPDDPAELTPKHSKRLLYAAAGSAVAALVAVAAFVTAGSGDKVESISNQAPTTEEASPSTNPTTTPEVLTNLEPIAMTSEDPRSLVEQEYSQNLNCALNAGGTAKGEVSEIQTACLENIMGNLSDAGSLYAGLSSVVVQVNQARFDNPDYQHPVKVTLLDSSLESNILSVLLTESDESGTFTKIAHFERTSPAAAGIAPNSGADLIWIMRDSFATSNPNATTLAEA